MTTSAIEKVYVILTNRHETQLEKLDEFLRRLSPYLNLTCNIYVLAPSLSEGMPQVERIQKGMKTFLRDNLFVRYYLHFLHPVPQGDTDNLDYYHQYYYRPWKLGSAEFDREGYMHEEAPRLMLFPVLAPCEEDEEPFVGGLLEMLKKTFLLPSLYLRKSTFSLSQNKELRSKAEKVYYGAGASKTPAEIGGNLFAQDLLEGSCVALRSGTLSMVSSCTPSLFIKADDGLAYPCMDAFTKGEALACVYAEVDLETMLKRCQAVRETERDCRACREHVIGQFSELPLPQGLKNGVGALLYRLGAMYQTSQDYGQAIRCLEKSLTLSPREEHGAIHFLIGLCQAEGGDYDEAVQSFARAESSHKGAYDLYFHHGLCYLQMGEYEKAADRFAKALTVDPPEGDLVRILICLGTCYNNLGAYHDALAHLERARAADSGLKEIYSALGVSYFQLKDYDKAITHLNKAVEIDPASAADYASLGANYREKGDRQKAVAMFEKALALDPSMTNARENLERLNRQD
ncbi:MAG: tetratricopeptide repeat protein [Desulfobacterales bacterium]|nr:MAG: tetratricopeptide repeat protein [Desulfobacterales bacterium]